MGFTVLWQVISLVWFLLRHGTEYLMSWWCNLVVNSYWTWSMSIKYWDKGLQSVMIKICASPANYFLNLQSVTSCRCFQMKLWVPTFCFLLFAEFGRIPLALNIYSKTNIYASEFQFFQINFSYCNTYCLHCVINHCNVFWHCFRG